MKISEVSEKYNISTDTLRYYEKFGLIDNVSKCLVLETIVKKIVPELNLLSV